MLLELKRLRRMGSTSGAWSMLKHFSAGTLFWHPGQHHWLSGASVSGAPQSSRASSRLLAMLSSKPMKVVVLLVLVPRQEGQVKVEREVPTKQVCIAALAASSSLLSPPLPSKVERRCMKYS